MSAASATVFTALATSTLACLASTFGAAFCHGFTASGHFRLREGTIAVGVESFHESAGLGPLARPVNALDGDQDRFGLSS